MNLKEIRERLEFTKDLCAKQPVPKELAGSAVAAQQWVTRNETIFADYEYLLDRCEKLEEALKKIAVDEDEVKYDVGVHEGECEYPNGCCSCLRYLAREALEES